MDIAAHGATHTGRVREANEDSFHCGQTVFAVADGLGGHAAGEVASALALEPVADLDGRRFAEAGDAVAALADALRAGNAAILSDARANRARAGMGTTVTAALLHGGQLLFAHVGDSRAYLLRPDDGLRQLTTDHTPVQEAVQAGRLTAEEAAGHPERHVLTRVVGLEPDLDVDTPPPVELRPGDRVLLCSDGLTEVVADDRIAEILGDTARPAQACERLVEETLAGGAPDNVTVVVLAAS